jgi:acyl carrier protein
MNEDAIHGSCSDPADSVRRTIEAHLPLSFRDRAVPDSLRLGPEGAGLDSVALVELLLACEEATGIPFTADVLADGPLTIGHLVRHAVTRQHPAEFRASR